MQFPWKNFHPHCNAWQVIYDRCERYIAINSGRENSNEILASIFYIIYRHWNVWTDTNKPQTVCVVYKTHPANFQLLTVLLSINAHINTAHHNGNILPV